jgi:hypothetical protein
MRPLGLTARHSGGGIRSAVMRGRDDAVVAVVCDIIIPPIKRAKPARRRMLPHLLVDFQMFNLAETKGFEPLIRL